MRRKRYDQDFKLEAVNLVIKDNRPVAAAASELGIYLNTLYKWIRQVSEYEGNVFPDSGSLRPKMKNCVS